MNIVLEGLDNSGKSSLARILSSELERIVVSSEGPEKYEGEINVRVAKYLTFRRVIFDRHPCVSQPIYNLARSGKGTPVDEDFLRVFYDTRPLFVYCIAPASRGLGGHRVKEHDSEQHLKDIERDWENLRTAYTSWAHSHAHIFYRWGDSIETLIKMVKGALDE